MKQPLRNLHDNELAAQAAAGGRRPGLFPHLYGPLPLSAVRSVAPLPLGEDGAHRFPPEIP